MEISDVRVRLVKDAGDRLKAVCTVTLDNEFVVRDVKVVEGTSGLFVAMPSRKLTVPCARCRTQNHLRAKHCNECGGKLPPAKIPADDDGREKAHRDVAHPINSVFRQRLQERVLEAYRVEYEAGGTGEPPPEPQSGFEPESEVEQEMLFEERDQPREHEEEGISDYNSLIADLRGSGGSAGGGGGGGGGEQRRPPLDRPRGPRPQPAPQGRRPQPQQGRGPRPEERRDGGRGQGRGEPPRQRSGGPPPRRGDDRGNRGPRPSRWDAQREAIESKEQPAETSEWFDPGKPADEAMQPPAPEPMPAARERPVAVTPAPRPVQPRPVEPKPVVERPKPVEPPSEPEDSFGAGLL